MLGMAHWVGAPDFDAIVETHAARMAATTRHGLVPVLRSMAEKLKVRPELFGIYPRVDLSLAQAKWVSRSNACAPAITSAPAQADHCAAAPRRCRRGEARKLAFTNVRWWPGP